MICWMPPSLEAGQMSANHADTDVSHLVRLTAGYFETVAHQQEVRYVVECDAPVVAQLDPDKVQRIVYNLLANALEVLHSPQAASFVAPCTETAMTVSASRLPIAARGSLRSNAKSFSNDSGKVLAAVRASMAERDWAWRYPAILQTCMAVHWPLARRLKAARYSRWFCHTGRPMAQRWRLARRCRPVRLPSWQPRVFCAGPTNHDAPPLFRTGYAPCGSCRRRQCWN